MRDTQVVRLPAPDWTLHKLLDHHTAVSECAASVLSAVAQPVFIVPGQAAWLITNHDKTRKTIGSNLSLWGAACSASLKHSKIHEMLNSIAEWAEAQAPDEDSRV